MNTRRSFLALMGAAGAAPVISSLPAGAQSPTFLTMRGGGSAGTWYIGSAVISTIVNREVADTIMTATLGAGNRNITDVHQGTAQYGFAVGRSAVEGYEGIGAFDEPHTNVRAMMSMFPLTFQIIARKDSGIRTFDDLIGKRISAGQQGFTTLAVITELLKIKGHTLDDVDYYYLNYADANQQFQDGQLDAVVSLTGFPSPPYVELESLFPISVVELDQALVASFTEAFPGYSPAVVPGGSYATMETDASTVASPTLMIVRNDRSDDEVYGLTKAIFEHRSELANAAAAYRDFTPENVMNGIGIPLHPGAERFWRETGVLK